MDKTQLAISVFDLRASEYQNKYMDISLYSDSFDLFCDRIAREHADILEIACGPGNITRYLLLKRPDFKILATDLSPNMLALARTNNPQAEFQLMDARDIGLLDKSYDGIMCGFCLPYLSRTAAVQFIRDASRRLKPGGVLYLSTMEGEESLSGLHRSSQGDEIYLYYHRGDDLLEALRENGMRVVEVERMPLADMRTNDLLIIAESRAGFAQINADSKTQNSA